MPARQPARQAKTRNNGMKLCQCELEAQRVKKKQAVLFLKKKKAGRPPKKDFYEFGLGGIASDPQTPS